MTTPSQLRQTRTVVVLGISRAAFDEISQELRAAGYDHVFMPDGEIDMSGIAVAADADGAQASTAGAEMPIDMILYCPNCGKQHIDAPDTLAQIMHAGSGTVVDEQWTNPPHKSHLCHGCQCVWRPADVPTNGVAELKSSGKGDTWPAVHNDEVRAMPAHGVAAWRPVARMVALDDGLETVILEFIGERPPAGSVLYAPGVPGRPPTKQEDAVLHHAARAAGKVVAPGKLAEGVPAVDAMKRGAAERVMSGIEAGRRAFRAGKPREGLSNGSERIGWDEAAHDSGVVGTQDADASRLDWLERERADARKHGFQWNTWAYDALQSELTIREQIDKERGARGVTVVPAPILGYRVDASYFQKFDSIPKPLRDRAIPLVAAGVLGADGEQSNG